MPGRQCSTDASVMAGAGVVVALVAAVNLARWCAREATRLALACWHDIGWIALGAVAALALAVTVAARHARGVVELAELIEPERAEHAEHAPAAPVEPCAYGPDCPRCTGFGAAGQSQMVPNNPPEPRPADAVAELPGRRRAHRKAA